MSCEVNSRVAEDAENNNSDSVLSKSREQVPLTDASERDAYFKFLDLVTSDKELAAKNLDFEFLVKFLLCQSFDPNLALKHVKGYFYVRSSFPGIYAKPSSVRDVYEQRIMFKPDIRGKNGEGIMIIRVGNWNPQTMTAEHALSGGIAYSELTPWNDQRRRAGIYEIVDAKGLSWSQIWSLKLSDYKLLAEATEIGQTFKFNSIIVINASSIVDFVYNKFIKWFFTKDFREKIKIYSGDWSEIFELLPREAVPQDMKGSLQGPDSSILSEDVIRDQDEQVEKYWSKYS